MAEMFRVALSGDFRKADGSPTYPDFDLGPLRAAKDVEIAFPESVVQLFHGDMGQPLGGFPAALQRKILKGVPPLTERPGATLQIGRAHV